jgi:hypothetical protein
MAHCAVSDLAAALTRENIQYSVCSEENFAELMERHHGKTPVMVIESRSVLNDTEQRALAKFEKSGGRVVVADRGDWLVELKRALPKPSVTVEGPASVRVVVRDQGKHTIVHIYNLNVEKISSYEDKLHPAENVRVKVRLAAGRLHSARFETADSGTSFSAGAEENGTVAIINLSGLQISAIVVIE